MVMSNLEETNQNLQLAFALVRSSLLHGYRELLYAAMLNTTEARIKIGQSVPCYLPNGICAARAPSATAAKSVTLICLA